MDLSRRRYLAGLGASLALAGCGGSDGQATATPTTTPKSVSDNPVATAPIPDSPATYTYATMGEAGAEHAFTYVGNWKCPFCAQFSVGQLPTLLHEYVAPGRATLTYRGLAYTGNGPFLGPDAPRATRAGLAVWNEASERYWPFHEYVMANQPSESEAWATTDRLVSMAEAAGVEATDAIRSALASGAYEDAVRATTDYANEHGVTSTPTLVVGESTVNPLDLEDTRATIESELGLTPAGST